MGLGKSGFACVRHLHQLGFEVEVIDTRAQPPMLDLLKKEFPDTRFTTGAPEIDYLNGFDTVVVSPGLSVRQGAVAEYINAGNQVVGDVELFAQQAKAPIIAITGANGKSTVTDLVGHILHSSKKVLVGGNIGTPVLELLDQPVPDVYVLELSSFQLETTHSLNAFSSVVLNISEDHMDRYRDIDDYASTKQKIFQGDGLVVLNRDDARVLAMKPASRDIRFFTLEVPATENEYGLAEYENETWLYKGHQPLFPASEVRLAGRHNLANVLAALALIEPLMLSPESVRRAVGSYTGLSHRCEVVAEQNNVRWINDSKATNVGATIAALQGMDGPVILVAGGEGKDADFQPLRPVVEQSARAVILIGRDAGLIEEALNGSVPIYRAGSMQEAVEHAANMAWPGDVVMLSPACASFDMFDNFEHRGSVFAELARSMAAKAGRLST